MLQTAEVRSGRILSSLVLALGLALLTGCAGLAGNGQPSSAVAIIPATADVRAGDTLQFTAKVSGTMFQSVVGSVNGTVGGNATMGKISASGVYTAPAALPSPNSVSVEATSSSDKSLSGKSQITLENPVPTVTAISPTTVAVGNFSITITGTKFVNGAAVMLGGQKLTTKFVSSTELMATGTTTTSQKGMSLALMVSNPDPGSTASASLMIKVGLPSLLVTITPASVQLRPGQTAQFKASVSGTTDQTVTWVVNGVKGGNATVGTITQTGLYTAPAVAGATSAQVGAVPSAAGNVGGGPSLVTLLSNLPVLTSVLPTPLPVGNFTIAVSGNNFLNGAQVVFNGTLLTTTFISGTSLSATGTAAASGTASVQVINPGSGSPTSNALQVQVGNTNSGVTAAAAARLLEQWLPRRAIQRARLELPDADVDRGHWGGPAAPFHERPYGTGSTTATDGMGAGPDLRGVEPEDRRPDRVQFVDEHAAEGFVREFLHPVERCHAEPHHGELPRHGE